MLEGQVTLLLRARGGRRGGAQAAAIDSAASPSNSAVEVSGPWGPIRR